MSNEKQDAQDELLSLGWDTEQVGDRMRAVRGAATTAWFETWEQVLDAAAPRVILDVSEANGVTVHSRVPLRVSVIYQDATYSGKDLKEVSELMDEAKTIPIIYP